ncbi:hypothetical protein EW026_g2703 [Hermanssonia centrifuga]|uniref:Enoyl reductase (ER) domain-containing protein n=1 Tax=Hermanssonia centrifuga TaxID=98765 RepID=A0A4S4KPF0_9APHY|nr:hypothetical protein EW026_g2703 [Hermanssonia centrifuga]
MRAARFYAPGDVRIDEIPEPTPKNGQVKIKIGWTGICGSDLHAYLAGIEGGTMPDQKTPHPVTGETLPIVLGHEFSGTIVELGSQVDSKRLAVGQQVCVEPLISCMKSTCGPCSSGTRNICPHASFLGIAGWGGGLSEYIAADQQLVFPLPADLPLEVGAMIEPLAVAWHAVKRSGFTPGSKCLIMGSGPIGLMVLKVLKARGASWIGVSEPSIQRRQMAAEHAADAVFDPRSVDVVAETRKVTHDEGADFVFDCAGIQASLDLAIHAVRPRGTIMNIALWGEKAHIDFMEVLMKEIFITGILGYDRCHEELLEAVAAGKFQGLEKLITRKIGLEDLVEKGIKALITEKDTQIKILVHP